VGSGSGKSFLFFERLFIRKKRGSHAKSKPLGRAESLYGEKLLSVTQATLAFFCRNCARPPGISTLENQKKKNM